MEERAIHISSINREKRGTSRPGDFTIKFNPSLKLDVICQKRGRVLYHGFQIPRNR